MLPVRIETPSEKEFKIDFVLCTRNREKNILNLLRSINGLVNCNLAEVTIVDSSNNPIQITPEEFSGIGKINLIHSQPGLPTQRNIGLSATVNPVIVFLDDDVLLESNFINATLHEFINEADLSGLGYPLKNLEFAPRKIFKGWYCYVNENSYGQVTKSGKNYWYPEVYGKANLKSPMWIPGCAMAFRRTHIQGLNFNPVLEEGLLGGYALGEDVDFSLRLYKLGKSLKFCTTTVVHHYEAPGERDDSLRLAQAQGQWLRFLTRSHKSYVNSFCVSLRLLSELIYVTLLKLVGRGSPTARICSWNRLYNFLGRSPYSDFN